MIDVVRKRPATSLLGLALDRSRMEAVLLRRTNGSAEMQKRIVATLSLDPLKDDPELVGREIRNYLEQAGIRERQCTVCLPLDWMLTLQSKLPDLPEADISSFIQIEAERGFPYGPDSLFISASRFSAPGGDEYVTQVAIPKEHVLRLERALRAAKLSPVSFSIGISALQNPAAETSNGMIALSPGETSVALQLSSSGGVTALRTLESAFETAAGIRRFFADVIAREIRVTLGQLPPELRASVRRLRVLGASEHAQRLAEEIRPRAEAMGLTVERISQYQGIESDVKLAPSLEVSPAVSLAARKMAGRSAVFEFLPPKVSMWQQFARRHSAKKLVWAGGAAGAAALIVALAFVLQQWQLSRLQSEWGAMAANVTEVDSIQQQIKKFRPWFDDSRRSLAILRKLTEAFPEDGVVSAKTIEIREPSLVICSGVTRDQPALLKVLDALRANDQIGNITVDQVRGQNPMQFTFNFHWSGAHDN